LNPSRSFANILEGRPPWARDTCGRSVKGSSRSSRASNIARDQETAVSDAALAAPFEFAFSFQPQRFLGNGESCVGGGAAAAFRLTPSYQLIADVGGCKMIGLEKNVSGDSLTYMVGPRWISRVRGPWNAYLQFLAGGTKVTQERMHPQVKQMLLKKNPTPDNRSSLQRSEYVDLIEANGFGLKTGGGLSYKLNSALTFTVAEISYNNAWLSPLWGRDYSRSLQWSSKLILKMGTW
jgi:hypothetical protein